jgi:hypothetical protein
MGEAGLPLVQTLEKVSFFSKASPGHQNQDYFVAGPGYVAVMDGVSIPLSDNAACIVGRAIQKGMRAFGGGDPATPAGRKGIVEFLSQVMVQANEALNRFNTQKKYVALGASLNWSASERVQDEATTAVLTVVMKGTDDQYYFFSFQAGDSESVIYRAVARKIERLNPFLVLGESKEWGQAEGQCLEEICFGLDGDPLPSRSTRSMRNPGNCFDGSGDWQPVVTVGIVPEDGLLITSSDGLGDNVTYTDLEGHANAHPNPKDLLAYLSKLTLGTKQDDITVVAAQIRDIPEQEEISGGSTVDPSFVFEEGRPAELKYQLQRILLESYSSNVMTKQYIRDGMNDKAQPKEFFYDCFWIKGKVLGEKYKSCVDEYNAGIQNDTIDLIISQIDAELVLPVESNLQWTDTESLAVSAAGLEPIYWEFG